MQVLPLEVIRALLRKLEEFELQSNEARSSIGGFVVGLFDSCCTLTPAS